VIPLKVRFVTGLEWKKEYLKLKRIQKIETSNNKGQNYNILVNFEYKIS